MIVTHWKLQDSIAISFLKKCCKVVTYFRIKYILLHSCISKSTDVKKNIPNQIFHGNIHTIKFIKNDAFSPPIHELCEILLSRGVINSHMMVSVSLNNLKFSKTGWNLGVKGEPILWTLICFIEFIAKQYIEEHKMFAQ